MHGGSPANLHAERAILGAFLKDTSLIALYEDRLAPEDFYQEPHRHVYAAITGVQARAEPVDLVTVGEELSTANKLDAIGGPVFLARLLDDCATTVGIERHIDIVATKSQLRQMITAATEIATEGYDPELNKDEFFDSAEAKIFDVLNGGKKQPTQHIEVVMKGTMEMLRKQLEQGGEMAGIPTGFVELDNLTMGLQRTDLIIVAARPGMGKTSFAISMAINVALHQHKSVALFSLEMGAEQLAMRMMASEGHVNLKDVRGGKPSMEDFRRLTEAMGRLSQSNIYLDDSASLSLADVRTRCRRLSLNRQGGGLDLVVIDYLQLMRPSSARIPREQQISEMSRGLKTLAKELKIPVICLSQLNRGLESRQDKRPILSDLRESGAIEQDADIIMFVYRDEVYNPDSEAKGVAEIIVGKQRNGPCGTANLAFIGKYTKFGNASRGSEF